MVVVVVVVVVVVEVEVEVEVVVDNDERVNADEVVIEVEIGNVESILVVVVATIGVEYVTVLIVVGCIGSTTFIPLKKTPEYT